MSESVPSSSGQSSGAADVLKVNIQGSLVKFALDVLPADSILSVKEKICKLVNDAAPTNLKLIYSGRILKDGQSVSECGIQSGHTLHLVKSSPKPPQTDQPTTVAAAVAQADAPAASAPLPGQASLRNVNELLASALGTNGVFSQPEAAQPSAAVDDFMGRMLEEMAANPSFSQAFASHYAGQMTPEMRQMVQNPEIMRMAAQMVRSGAFSHLNPASDVQGASVGGAAAEPQANATADPETRFSTQLQQLNEMGFWDKQSNIQALLISNGSVSQAIEYLLSHPPE